MTAYKLIKEHKNMEGVLEFVKSENEQKLKDSKN